MKIITVDAFVSEDFSGNPAAVCILEDKALFVDEKWMQSVAARTGLSETAFLYNDGEGESFSLRWFTPAIEVELCGHATLAAAHVLWVLGIVASDAACRFNTKSGTLIAKKTGSIIEMDFPAVAVRGFECGDEQLCELASAISSGLEPIGMAGEDVFSRASSEGALCAIDANFRALSRALSRIGARGAIVTSLPDDKDASYDFVSRFFAPAIGIDEDPVTGSAHCALGPFWADVLSKRSLIGYQASEQGGIVKVVVSGDSVIIGGEAAIVAEYDL